MNKSRRLGILILVASVTVCACLSVLPNYARAADKECHSLMKQINDAVDRVAEVSERIGKVQQKVEDSGSNPTREHTLQTDKATLKKTKVQIDQLLDKLCDCCSKKSAQTNPARPGKECHSLMKQIS